MVAQQQLRVDLAVQTYMDDLLDAVSINDLGEALSRLARTFGFKQTTIIDGAGGSGADTSSVLYPRGSQDGEGGAAPRVPTLTALRLTRESERPLSFGDIRTALGGKGEGLLLGEDLQTNGLLLCAPARSKSFWYLKFEGCMGDVDGAARAVLHVAGELARWRLEEFSHSTSAAIPLTARERQVMRLLSWGKTDSEAAQELKISARTVRFHVDNAKRKLGVASRAQAIVLSLRGRQSTARLGDDAESWPARRQGGVE